jgi:hypothetical protein
MTGLYNKLTICLKSMPTNAIRDEFYTHWYTKGIFLTLTDFLASHFFSINLLLFLNNLYTKTIFPSPTPNQYCRLLGISPPNLNFLTGNGIVNSPDSSLYLTSDINVNLKSKLIINPFGCSCTK